jgi:hypothetical protein
MEPALTALAPTGLRRRIARILSGERCTSPATWRAAALAGGTVLCVLATSIGSIRAIAATAVVTAPPVDVREWPPALDRDVVSQSAPDVRTDPRGTVPMPPLASSRPPRTIDARPAHFADRLPIAPMIESTTPPRLPEIRADRVDVAFHGGAPRGVSPTGDPAAPPLVPWREAASAGVAVGRESRDAAVAAAGYFTRLGKRVAGAF